MYSKGYTVQDPELLYDKQSLDPVLNEVVVKTHFDKHTISYYKKVRDLIKGTSFSKIKTLDELLNSGHAMADTVLLSNAAQAWNHRFYWESLTPEDQQPSGALKKAIEDQFDTVDKFKEKFIDKATSFFGSGWVWLVASNGTLQIKTTPNASLLPEACHPIFVIDVWEHAYYLQYPADKASYCKAIWKLINWKFAEENYTNGTS